MKTRIHLLNCLVATMLMTGCMGYQLGGSRPEGIERVSMAPVINKTGEPAVELQVTHALRNRIQFDGRMQLENKAENADAVIEITLTRYHLQPIAYRSDLGTTPQAYRLRLTGIAKLKDASTGEIISTSKTYGESAFEFTDDLTTAKRDALPGAARELAKFMLDDLIERW